MKKVVYLLILCACLVVVMSCSSTKPIMYQNNQNTNFTVLGPVELSVTDNMMKDGYGLTMLLNEAKKQYPNADYVIDIIVDQQSVVYIPFIFATNTYIMRGTAIRYTR
ncbi:MAG: hypothetical protein FWD24_06090 [Treponema sp.]|nr:hypothetical protein [Treponema sp.]